MVKIRHIILIVTSIIIGIIIHISTSNINHVVDIVLKDIVKADINIGNISISSKSIDIDNININDLDNNKVANINKIKIKINPFLPSRLSSIKIIDADLVVKRYKDNTFNFDNIFPSSEDNTSEQRKNKISKINHIKVVNTKIQFIDYSFDETIQKQFYNGNGYITQLNNNLDINLTTNIDDNQKLSIKFSTLKKSLQLKFDNVFVDKLLSQYISYNDIYVSKGYVNGTLTIDAKNELKLNGSLDVDAQELYYSEYDDLLHNVKASAKFKDNRIIVNANTLIDNSPLNINIDILLEKDINIRLKLKDIEYKNANKYSLIKVFNLPIEGRMQVDANINIDDKKLNKLYITAKADKLSLYNQQLSNAKLIIKKDENKIDTGIVLKFDMKDVFNSKVDINLNLSLDSKKGRGKLKLESDKGSINSDILVNSYNDILFQFKDNLISGDLEYKDKEFLLNAILNHSLAQLKISGKTDKNLQHKYSINIKGDNILADADLWGEKLNVNAKLDIKEIWYGYHRLKNIIADASYENNILSIDNIKNSNLDGYFKYDINKNELDSNLILKKYILYNHSNYNDINLYVPYLSIDLNGKLDNIKGNIKIDRSDLMVNNRKIGILKFEGNIENDKLDFYSSVNDSFVYGEYDLISQYMNINIFINQNISSLINLKDINSKLKANINLYGTVDNIQSEMNVVLDNIKYQDYDIPKMIMSAKYENGNLDNLIKTGVLKINNLSILSSNNSDIYSIKDLSLDLGNINIDYNIQKEINLNDINDKFGGKILIHHKLKGNFDKYYGELNIESKDILFNGTKLNNLIFGAKINETGLTIDYGYFEYEKNPVLLEGYVDFKQGLYNVRMFADNFNLDFLKFNDSIDKAKGIANLDFEITNNDLKGSIKFDNVNIKTEKYNINNFNIDIFMKNEMISINKFNGSINNGSVNMSGEFEIPRIPDDFLTRKKVELGKADLTLDIKDVNLPILSNNILLSGNAKLDSSDLKGNILVKGGLIDNIDFLNKKSKNKTEIQKKINEYIDSILSQYRMDINISIEKPIDVKLASYLIIKNINAQLLGDLNAQYINGKLSILGNIYSQNANYEINSNKFVIEELLVRLDDPLVIDPEISLKSTADLKDDKIKININSKLSALNIQFESEMNKSQDEILKSLAFKTLDGIDFSSIKSIGNNIVEVGVQTAINKYINTITNKFGRKIGLKKLEVNADIGNNIDYDVNNIFNNTSIILDVEGNLFNIDKLNWNIDTKIPVKGKNLKYNINLSYNIYENLKGNIGVKNNMNEINKPEIYGGVSYSRKFNDLSDIFDKIDFRKKETLKKVKE